MIVTRFLQSYQNSLIREKEGQIIASASQFPGISRNFKSTTKSILRDFTKKGNSQSASLAKIYLVKQEKTERDRKEERSTLSHSEGGSRGAQNGGPGPRCSYGF
jgi:hypothetical protein